MMQVLTNLHSYLAYTVFAILVFAVGNALLGWFRKKEFRFEKDLRISLFALIMSHIQLLVGLIVYFTSASGINAIQTVGMKNLNTATRLLALEHPMVNILAVALITIGWSRHKKKEGDSAKFKNIAIFYGLGLLLILSRIPWGLWFN